MAKAKPKQPTTPKLCKALTVPCGPDDTPDTFGTRTAGLILDPSSSTLRVVKAAEGESDIGDLIHADGFKKKLKADAKKIRDGDLSQVEEMLLNQAISLQTIYTRLMERAMQQDHIPGIDLFLRHAMRAQNQSRLTMETLSAVKNPPVVFAKQANISQGHQQINNGIPAHVEKPIAQNELLEQTHGKRLDTRAAATSGRVDSAVEALGKVHGATN